MVKLRVDFNHISVNHDTGQFEAVSLLRRVEREPFKGEQVVVCDTEQECDGVVCSVDHREGRVIVVIDPDTCRENSDG